MEGSAQADALAKQRADADGGQMTAAKALTTEQLRTELCASFQFAAHFHAQMEDWGDGDEIVPREKEAWFFVPKQ